MKLAIILFIAGAAWIHSCSAQVPQCPPDTINVPPMENFNFGLIFPKWWYIQEIYYRRAEEVMEPRGRCLQQSVQESFIEGSTSYREDWTTPNGQFNKNSKWASPGIYWNDAAIWSVTQSWFYLEYKTTYALTDYETYGVMHWCSLVDWNADIPYERVMVFTGSMTPNETLLEDLRGMVAGLGFPTEHSVRVNTTDCEYCWGEECPDYPIYDDDEEQREEGNNNKSEEDADFSGEV